MLWMNVTKYYRQRMNPTYFQGKVDVKFKPTFWKNMSTLIQDVQECLVRDTLTICNQAMKVAPVFFITEFKSWFNQTSQHGFRMTL